MLLRLLLPLPCALLLLPLPLLRVFSAWDKLSTACSQLLSRAAAVASESQLCDSPSCSQACCEAARPRAMKTMAWLSASERPKDLTKAMSDMLDKLFSSVSDLRLKHSGWQLGGDGGGKGSCSSAVMPSLLTGVTRATRRRAEPIQAHPTFAVLAEFAALWTNGLWQPYCNLRY